jgi:acetyltransferase
MQPYPSHLVRRLPLPDGTPVTIRPIRPEDAELEQEFVRALSDESRYFRFMDSVRELSPRMLTHFVNVDYDLHMALIAVHDQQSREIEIGVARYVAEESRLRCEFAIAIADTWRRKGVGALLMRDLMAVARAAGVRVMYGDVLTGNQRMLQFSAKLGFRSAFNDEDPRTLRVEIDL